jgi:hypothetical protein
VATQPLADYVRALDAEIRVALQIQASDLRLSKGEEYGFGRWKVYLGEIALENPPPPGHYLVDMSDERVACVAAALAPISALVVQG